MTVICMTITSIQKVGVAYELSSPIPRSFTLPLKIERLLQRRPRDVTAYIYFLMGESQCYFFCCMPENWGLGTTLLPTTKVGVRINCCNFLVYPYAYDVDGMK